MILLTPGPCMTSDTVRRAAGQPDLNHRDPAFAELQAEVKARLLRVYPGLESFVPCLIGGSGTAAVEAMVASCVREGPVLVIENGYYSARIRELLEVHRIPHDTLSYPWLGAWDLNEIRRTLDRRRYEAVVATHHETTTGRLNPIEALADAARPSGCRVLVDAMSSFGADPLSPIGLSAIAASSNKCLHGLPGVSFVFVEPGLAEAMSRGTARTYYLHLPRYFGDRPPMTPPVSALAALRQALREMPEGQAASRHRDYARRATLIRAGLDDLGATFAVPEAESSCALVVPTLPSGYRLDVWLAANRRRGFALYETKGDLATAYYQVSPMGEVRDDQILAWLGAARDLYREPPDRPTQSF
ncbi:MAG: aminotransferase class V-fold PLP-dependent enzyme [Fimbriimonadaceae bacterium]|nr:aminotransferase class V-fold PLP-dependent enzyme [Fimbriimonadaceae bacterium]